MVESSGVGPETRLETLGIDSLGLVECIFAIEEEFDIQVPFGSGDEAGSDPIFDNVGSIANSIEALIADQHK